MITLKETTKYDDHIISNLVSKLLSELRRKEVKESEILSICKTLNQTDERWHAYIAYDGNIPIGIITIYKVSAIYANGLIGIIQELYVESDYRNAGVGKLLIHEAVKYGRTHNFKNLEVGTPNVEKWPQTFKFYKNQNFKTIGDRMKLFLF
ncbi:GNAT family N-acetyltransferase [Mammaliicoccus sciuri]|uniref:GNAT family N-acetyltransferase n=1 Tax=Mammaliicoccus sciuri TaxID=1296 RepID=UPI001FB523D1|nr:GNAT family N-acetyltransferase [Mammaliicoccus sciuri]MCJ0952498.1 GNAT family N-acetyltransferase [Mammaliicoccus sciuri]